jgi:hypothetical protein
MAYVTQDQALNYLTGSEQPQQPQTSGDSGGAFVGGSSAGQQASGGLRPSFTNVSAYMKANQPDIGKGLQAVQTKGQDIIGQEKQALQTSGNEAKSKATQAQQSIIGQDQASKLMSAQGSQLKNNAKTIKDFLGQSAPTNPYQYQMGQGAQTVGQASTTPEGFNQYKYDIYRDITGQNLTTGQRALQNQFDVASGLESQTRQGLSDIYKGYETDVGNQAQDINKLYGDIWSQQEKAQSAIMKYLGKEQGLIQSDLQKQANALNKQSAKAQELYKQDQAKLAALENKLAKTSKYNKVNVAMPSPETPYFGGYDNIWKEGDTIGNEGDQVIKGGGDINKEVSPDPIIYKSKTRNKEYDELVKKIADAKRQQEMKKYSKGRNDLDWTNVKGAKDEIGKYNLIANILGQSGVEYDPQRVTSYSPNEKLLINKGRL